MENIFRGQQVWVSNEKGVIETRVKSVGTKYVTLECRPKKKFHRDTLREVDGWGVPDFIILDLEKYQTERFYSSLVQKLKRFDWNTLDRETLQKVSDLLKDSL